MIKDNHGYNQYTKEEIIELAQNWFDKHGRLVQRDLKHANGLPSSCQVTKHFGTEFIKRSLYSINYQFKSIQQRTAIR